MTFSQQFIKIAWASAEYIRYARTLSALKGRVLCVHWREGAAWIKTKPAMEEAQ
jgi:hypothetical protein